MPVDAGTFAVFRRAFGDLPFSHDRCVRLVVFNTGEHVPIIAITAYDVYGMEEAARE